MKRWGYEALKEIEENNKSKDKNSNKKKKSKEESKKKKRKNSTDDEKSSDEDSVDSLVFQHVSSQILKCQIYLEIDMILYYSHLEIMGVIVRKKVVKELRYATC